MALIIHRWLAVPAVSTFVAVVVTLPGPATAELMPPVTLFVFFFALAAAAIAASADAIVRFRTSRLPRRVRAPT